MKIMHSRHSHSTHNHQQLYVCVSIYVCVCLCMCICKYVVLVSVFFHLSICVCLFSFVFVSVLTVTVSPQHVESVCHYGWVYVLICTCVLSFCLIHYSLFVFLFFSYFSSRRSSVSRIFWKSRFIHNWRAKSFHLKRASKVSISRKN